MKKLNFFNIGRVVTLLFLSLFLNSHSIFAQDCPSLSKKTLELCNPSAEEVADALGAPVAIINGVRAVGEPDPSNATFYQTIKDQEYQFKWNFKDGSGNVVATGCPQTFELQDKEAPTCGAATLRVHGHGMWMPIVGTQGYATPEVLISEFRNQTPTWSDNCTESVNVDFDVSGIGNDNVWNGGKKNVSYTLTDNFGNTKTCGQTLSVYVDTKYECPAISQAIVEITSGSCNADCNSLVDAIHELPIAKMDGFGDDIDPNMSGSYPKIYYNKNTSSTTCTGDFAPGEHIVYFYYGGGANLYCPVSVIVKENSTPPACPNLEDIIIADQTTVNADVLEANIKSKVSSYGEQLDNCTPNANLDVVYTGSDLTEGFCGNVSYSLSDFGSMRSCVAKVVVLKCPELPQLTKKFCNYNKDEMPKSELVQFLNENKPSLSYCSNNIEGSYNTSDLSKSNYSNGNTAIVNWRFNVDGATKTCPQQIRIERNNSLSCVGKDVTLNAESNCKASGAGVPLPTVTACDNSYSLKWFKLSENTNNNATRHSISELSGTSFQNGDVIIWAFYYDESCRSTITVVDNTKPTCETPSLGTLSGETIHERSEVTSLFSALSNDQLGNDNCGIKEGSIDWDYTAFEQFIPGSGDKTYDIYYKIKDISGNENDGYCKASLVVEGLPEPKCPSAEITALSSDGSVAISLDPVAESWSVESPSGVSLNAGKLSGLSFSAAGVNVKLKARWNTTMSKSCTTTVKLLKSVPPCEK